MDEETTTFRLKISENQVQWSILGQSVVVSVPHAQGAKIFEKEDLVLILFGQQREGLKLHGYTLSGSKKFSCLPPDDYSFSHLSDHVSHKPCVVCGGTNTYQSWYDWHFCVDSGTGKMERLTPAY